MLSSLLPRWSLEVAEAVLEDGVGDIVEGREGRHVATSVDPHAILGPQFLGQVRSLSAAVLCLGHRKIF